VAAKVQNQRLLADQATLALHAYHEAGHVVIALYFGINFEYVTILVDPEFQTPGVKVFLEPQLSDISALPLNERFPVIRRYIIYSMAGQIAQEKFSRRSCFQSARSDRRFQAECERIAECYHALDNLKGETKKILDRPSTWHRVEQVAEALLQEKKLTYSDIVLLLGVIDAS